MAHSAYDNFWPRLFAAHRASKVLRTSDIRLKARLWIPTIPFRTYYAPPPSRDDIKPSADCGQFRARRRHTAGNRTAGQLDARTPKRRFTAYRASFQRHMRGRRKVTSASRCKAAIDCCTCSGLLLTQLGPEYVRMHRPKREMIYQDHDIHELNNPFI